MFQYEWRANGACVSVSLQCQTPSVENEQKPDIFGNLFMQFQAEIVWNVCEHTHSLSSEQKNNRAIVYFTNCASNSTQSHIHYTHTRINTENIHFALSSLECSNVHDDMMMFFLLLTRMDYILPPLSAFSSSSRTLYYTRELFISWNTVCFVDAQHSS